VAAQTIVSPELAAAQVQLLRLRAARGVSFISQGDALACCDHGRFPPLPSPHQFSLFDQVKQLPPHLGWESTAVTAVLRQPAPSPEITHPPVVIQHRGAEAQRVAVNEQETFVKVYPSVAQGMLREGLAAPGRVWLLLRILDENGRGWLTEAEAQALFTAKRSATYLFGKRQWRNIVKMGDGVFWRRENGRLWLNSVGKTAAALGVWQLNGHPVQIPAAVLTGKIGTVRAHLYATFHSSRTDKSQPKPIARETLTAQFNITPRTQRSYERTARVQSHQNYAVGKQESAENAKDAAWQHGAAAFSFIDHQGKHGRPGATYLAWQLPNHYFGPHQQACRGQQKRINRELADLFMKGMTGNDNQSVDEKSNLTAEGRRAQRKEFDFAFSAPLRLDVSKRFCGNGCLAAKVYNRNDAGRDVYWRNVQGVGNGRFQLWHVIEAQA
jgi:hypothetical protein